MAHHVSNGMIVPFAVQISTADIGDTGLAVKILIVRYNNGGAGDTNYWDGGAWNAGAHPDPPTLAMTEVSATDAPGLYVYNGLTAATADYSYRVCYYTASAAHPIDMCELWRVAEDLNIFNTTFEYKDVDGADQTMYLFDFIQGVFSVLRREMTRVSP